MKPMILAGALFAGVSAFAAQSPEQILLNAVAVCPDDVNPLSIVRRLGGNSFTGVQFVQDSESQIALSFVDNRQLYNSAIMTPLRILGQMKLEMTYPAPEYQLKCVVEVSTR